VQSGELQEGAVNVKHFAFKHSFLGIPDSGVEGVIAHPCHFLANLAIVRMFLTCKHKPANIICVTTAEIAFLPNSDAGHTTQQAAECMRLKVSVPLR
jgi:hypothetical protein